MSAAVDQRGFENSASLAVAGRECTHGWGYRAQYHARTGTGHCHTFPHGVGCVHALHVLVYRS